MIVAVPKEIANREKRVALVPESVAKLIDLKFTVQIESGAGVASNISDENYREAGAEIIKDAATLYGNADIILKVQGPMDHPSGKHELEMMKKGALVMSFFFPLFNFKLAEKAAKLGVNILSMDSIPRITKAQRMDTLSSQTNLAGYKAVLLAANALKKIFPLMMTAAGTIAPAKVVIMGAGVAGLQAIATAKRLGAIVEVSDVRPEVKEEVQSLGAKFIEVEGSADFSGEGGYAREVTQEFLKKQQEVLETKLKEADVVITTALVPGKKAPVLITEEMVKKMKHGAVIVDMATEQGGNCEASVMNETVEKHGVTIIGETNFPSLLSGNASELYSRNLFNLIKYLCGKEGKFELKLEDEIVAGSLIVSGGEVIHPATKKLLA